VRKVLYILGLLEDADINWLIGVGQRRRVPAGERLITEGEPISHLNIVINGSVEVYARGKLLAQLGQGEVVGEISLLDSRPPSATVSATENTIVLAVPFTELRAKLGRDPGFAARLYQALGVFLAQRLRNINLQLIIGTSPGFKLEEDEEELDEIDPEVLERITLAGSRFKWIIDRLSTS
jgi:CRP-like cAMP-binding protein